MTDQIEKKVTYRVVDEGSVAQKIDNFLIKILKGVPKSHVYKLLRSGQVRVNKKRVRTEFKLTLGDSVRIPPVDFRPKTATPQIIVSKKVEKSILDNILFEDESLIALNKPSGIAVHGGSGLSFGVIELFRKLRPNAKFLELIHRIDKETSGVLLIAKKRITLVNIQKQIREKRIHKKYQVGVSGIWNEKQKIVTLNLLKTTTNDGQKVRVVMSKNKQQALTSKSVFFLNKNFGEYSLLDVKLITGRTHQIRVHLAHLGYPVLGDDKYGDFQLNKIVRKNGLNRMFLHAYEYGFIHPSTQENLLIKANTPKELMSFIKANGN